MKLTVTLLISHFSFVARFWVERENGWYSVANKTIEMISVDLVTNIRVLLTQRWRYESMMQENGPTRAKTSSERLVRLISVRGERAEQGAFALWLLGIERSQQGFFFSWKVLCSQALLPHPLNQNEYTDCTVCQEEAVLHFMLPALSIFAHCGEYSAAVGERDWVPWWLAVHPVQSPSATSQQDLGNHRGGHRTPPPPPRQFSASVFPISLTFFPGSAQFVFLFSMAIDD